MTFGDLFRGLLKLDWGAGMQGLPQSSPALPGRVFPDSLPGDSFLWLL